MTKKILFALLAGCAAKEVVVGDLQEVVDMPIKPNPDIDILFVIDNSPSMADKQVSLAQNFPRMMDVLSTLDTGLPNLHIGVVTSDMGTSSSTAVPGPPVGTGPGGCAGTGDDGKLQKLSQFVTDNYIVDIANPDGTRTQNFPGDLATVFTTNALVGANGCGFEQHLSSMRAALDGHNTENSGFIRDGANLAVVILADEDDCSLKSSGMLGEDSSLGPLESYRCTRFGVTCDGFDPDNPQTDLQNCVPNASSQFVDDVAPYVDFLSGMKPDPRMLMVSTIVGDPTPFSTELRQPPGGGTPTMALAHSCTFQEPDSTVAVADPAVRLNAFSQAFEGRSSQTSICSADLSTALQQIGASAKRMIGDPCLTHTPLVDTCEVTAVSDSHPELAAQVPACKQGSLEQCYEIVADSAACSYTDGHLKLHVLNTAETPADTWYHARCQLEP